MKIEVSLRLCSFALCALLGSCTSLLPAPTPLRTIEYAAASTPGKCLFVMLPGMGDHAETFEQRGFVEEVRKTQRSIDIRTTDATIGYYMQGTMLDRLEQDVIAPAKARGYQEIWLLGPSMGGFGSLFYSRAHTADVTGVLAMAPFLGDKKLIKEISTAGGLMKWQAPARVEKMDRDNYQREMWRWFQAIAQHKEKAPLIFMGYGTSDHLAPADSMLGVVLPPSRVYLTDGKHEWPAWQRILQAFLASPEFASHCH